MGSAWDVFLGQEETNITFIDDLDISDLSRHGNSGGSWDPSSQKIFELAEILLHNFRAQYILLCKIHMNQSNVFFDFGLPEAIFPKNSLKIKNLPNNIFNISPQ